MASLFDAIVLQNFTVLTRGHTLRPHVLLPSERSASPLVQNLFEVDIRSNGADMTVPRQYPHDRPRHAFSQSAGGKYRAVIPLT